jgi:hypothetical protein
MPLFNLNSEHDILPLHIVEAIQKITGVTPAFMRPRTLRYVLLRQRKNSYHRTAYGEYNAQVLEVAGKYGQTVTIWDFEYTFIFTPLLFY